jgi:hypothetical protein
MWLTVCTPSPQSAGVAYAESPDGIHWVKPSLHQREYKGSTENNFFVVDPKLSWPLGELESVLYTPNDPDPARRYKGLMGAEYRVPVVGPDGIHWTQLDSPKLSSGDESNLSYDPLTRNYIATMKTWRTYGRAHAIWTSQDFQHWTNTKGIFQTDAEDQKIAKETIQARLADPTLQQPVSNNPADYNADVYNMGLFRYEGLYVGLPAIYHATGKIDNNTDGFHLIQLVCSRDLLKWERLGDRRPFIGPSPVGTDAYDLMQLLPSSFPLVRGDELWFYYSGLKYREPPKDDGAKWGAVCLAVLRRDGFISLDAGETPGVLTTKPFVVNGAKLNVNVDANGGTLNIEALNADGKTLAVAETVEGDQPHAEVHWKSGNLADLQGQPVVFRFTLKNAKLYSFWME